MLRINYRICCFSAIFAQIYSEGLIILSPNQTPLNNKVKRMNASLFPSFIKIPSFSASDFESYNRGNHGSNEDDTPQKIIETIAHKVYQRLPETTLLEPWRNGMIYRYENEVGGGTSNDYGGILIDASVYEHDSPTDLSHFLKQAPPGDRPQIMEAEKLTTSKPSYEEIVANLTSLFISNDLRQLERMLPLLFASNNTLVGVKSPFEELVTNFSRLLIDENSPGGGGDLIDFVSKLFPGLNNATTVAPTTFARVDAFNSATSRLSNQTPALIPSETSSTKSIRLSIGDSATITYGVNYSSTSGVPIESIPRPPRLSIGESVTMAYGVNSSTSGIPIDSIPRPPRLSIGESVTMAYGGNSSTSGAPMESIPRPPRLSIGDSVTMQYRLSIGESVTMEYENSTNGFIYLRTRTTRKAATGPLGITTTRRPRVVTLSTRGATGAMGSSITPGIVPNDSNSTVASSDTTLASAVVRANDSSATTGTILQSSTSIPLGSTPSSTTSVTMTTTPDFGNRVSILQIPGCSAVDGDGFEIQCSKEAKLDFDEIYLPSGVFKFTCDACDVQAGKLDESFCKFASTAAYGLYSAVFNGANLTEISSNALGCLPRAGGVNSFGDDIVSKRLTRLVIRRTPDSRLTLADNMCGDYADINTLQIAEIKYPKITPNTFKNCSIRWLQIEQADLAGSGFAAEYLLNMAKTPVHIKFIRNRIDTVNRSWDQVYRQSSLDNGCIADFDLGGSGSVSMNCDYRVAWVKEHDNMEKRIRIGDALCRWPPELSGARLRDVKWEQIAAISTQLPTTTEPHPDYGDYTK